ncbi:MAG: cytochrome c [Roseobacter sp.]
MKFGSSFLVVVLGLLAASTGTAQDLSLGEDIYKSQCRSCHGPTAKGMASYPKLVGHPADYLTDKLKRYRAGEKIGPNTMLMAPNAQNLSDADIASIAAFITSLE